MQFNAEHAVGSLKGEMEENKTAMVIRQEKELLAWTASLTL